MILKIFNPGYRFKNLRLGKTFNYASSFNLFWNTKYYQDKPRCNEVYSRNNLPD